MARKETCSNCGESAPLTRMITVSTGNRIIAKICPPCQRAKKIQITLERDKKGDWAYYQYFPVEV